MPTYFYYVDESGRDPFAGAFIVGLLITGRARLKLGQQLLALEKTSKKRLAKWGEADWRYRHQYINGLTRIESLANRIFFHLVRGTKDYVRHTADATVNAVRTNAKTGDQVKIFYDGFTKADVAKIKRQVRPSFKGKGIRIIV